jgi:endonuclease/exonuclease/phosphatase family metal-dependent hydrolase
MKKILIPLIALAIVSCAKEENHSDASYDGPTQTISIKTNYNEDTKAVYTDGQGMSWTSTDATELGLLCGSAWTQATSSAIAVGTSDATFTASVPVGTTSFAAYYPISAVSGVSGSVVTFAIPKAQSQAAAGASDDKQIMLVSKSVSKSGDAFTANMKPAAALVRFVLYSTDETLRAQSVTAVTLNGTDNIAGSMAYDFSSGSSALTGSASSVTVTLGTAYALTNASSKDADGTKGIYAQVAPGSVIKGFTVEAASGAKTEFTFSSPKTIKGSGITNVIADLSKGDAYVTVSDFAYLQATINACPAGVTVRVGAGTFTGSLVPKDGVNISGGWDPTFATCDPSTYVTVLDGGGSAVALSQSATFTNKTTISGLTIKNGKNTNTTSNGGCVSLLGGVVLDYCKVTGRSANQGAGVYITGASTISNSTVSGNTSTTHGAGIYLNAGASAINCISENNTATGNGGGINVNGYATIDRCFVRGNKSAADGAGMSLRSADSRGVVVSNCLVEGNTNTASGASGINIYSSDGGKPVMIYNCTIVENTNSESGEKAVGVYCSDQRLYFANNIVYGNIGSTSQVYLNSYGATNGPYLSNNAITSGSLKLLNSSTSVLGAIDLAAKPYGFDFRLSAASVCVDAGASDMAVYNGIYSLSLTQDLDGKARVSGLSPDIGCYEYQGTSTPTYSTKIRLATFNIRCIKDTDTGVRSWTTRKNYCKTIINDNSLDVIGFQEVTTTQAGDLRTLLGDKYLFYFIGRDDGTNGECVGVGYDRSLFSTVNKGYFWLSPTPDTYLNALAWGGTHNRIAVWMRLKFLTTGDEFYIMATHLEVNGDGTDMSEVRRKSAELIISRAKSIDTDRVPFFLVGDMNAASLNEPAQAEFKTYFTDAYYSAENKGVRSGCISTYNAFEDAPNLSNAARRADYIYMRGSYDLRGYNVVQTKYDGNWPSDHMPVYIDVKF